MLHPRIPEPTHQSRSGELCRSLLASFLRACRSTKSTRPLLRLPSYSVAHFPQTKSSGTGGGVSSPRPASNSFFTTTCAPRVGKLTSCVTLTSAATERKQYASDRESFGLSNRRPELLFQPMSCVQMSAHALQANEWAPFATPEVGKPVQHFFQCGRGSLIERALCQFLTQHTVKWSPLGCRLHLCKYTPGHRLPL